MKILLIGGTRFIGRHVIPALLSQGHEVVLFNRGRTPNPFLGEIEIIIGDRKVKGNLAEQTAGRYFDAVVDMIPYDRNDTEDAVQAFNGRIGHYIMISTRSVYRQPVNVPIREYDLLENNPDIKYGYHKAQAENVLMQAYGSNKFPATILRLPAVYGEFDYQAREWYFIKRLLDKREKMLLPDYGCGMNQREYTGNIAAQIAFILANPSNTIGQIYNSGHSEYNRYIDLVRIAAGIVDQHIEFYGISNVDMPWGVPLANDGVRITSTAKLEALGYMEPFNVRQGLVNIISYFTENPVSEWIMETRQNKNLFNYEVEDKIIAEKAIKL